MALLKEKKTELINEFKIHPSDTGSANVQIALLTQRINSLMEHFKVYKNDFHSRCGLLKLVSQRRKLLDYLKKRDKKIYQQLVEKLQLRK